MKFLKIYKSHTNCKKTILFKIRNGLLYCKEKICVQRKSVKNLLFIARDNKTSGHFRYLKNLSGIVH